MVILDIRIDETLPIRRLKSKIPAITRDTLKATAAYFHREILPSHFGPANRRKYNHEPRNRVYAKEIKVKAGVGQGKRVDNVLVGKTKRRAMAFAKISGTRSKATLRVEVPAYVTRPFVGSFRDPKTGRMKRITRQPDKVAELKRVDEADKTKLREFADKEVSRQISVLERMRDAAQRIVRG